MLQNMLVGKGKEKYGSLNGLFPTIFPSPVVFAASFPASHPGSMNSIILSPGMGFASWSLSREDNMDAEPKEAQFQSPGSTPMSTLTKDMTFMS